MEASGRPESRTKDHKATGPAARSSSPLLLLGGPTAVGKSAVGLRLAECIGGEIISVDSMQVYRGLDIGTAKPTPEERGRVPHHLIDILDLTESFDAAQFAQRATQAVQDVRSRGRIPIFCGGTGLYFRALLQGLGEAPPADVRLRAELESIPLRELLRELQQCDPITFQNIDRRNSRRVVRAVEVIRLTGRPYSGQRARWHREGLEAEGEAQRVGFGGPDLGKVIAFFCFERARDDLRARIDRRVEQMFQRGLVAETERLLAQGLAKNKIALQALGYRQVAEYLRGEHSLAATVELVKTRTRQFAKRQMTWFRHQSQPQWIVLAAGENEDLIVARLLRLLGESALPGDPEDLPAERQLPRV